MTEDALLRAVLADPDDDAPRLILADWLDEHGQAERAEFIRLQIALANMSPGTGQGSDDEVWCDCRYCALRCRERELQQGAAKWWSDSGLPDWVKVLEWRRGFAHSISISGFDWLELKNRILALQPVRSASMTIMPMYARHMADDYGWVVEAGEPYPPWPELEF